MASRIAMTAVTVSISIRVNPESRGNPLAGEWLLVSAE